MDVFALREDVIHDYADYVRSFVTIRDSDIDAFVTKQFTSGVLWPQALLQLNPAFEPGQPLIELAADGILHPECLKIFRDKPAPDEDNGPLQLHRHQVEGIRAAHAGDNFVVTTGTGSGKSLAYIVPIVDHVLRSRAEPGRRGIKEIVVYPMNALANSQLGELRKFLEHGYPKDRPPVRFAQYTGQEKREQRERILADPPDILLTNYVMLELLLTRPFERQLIHAARDLRFLVLDELHTYRGRPGAHVALLVRRVREACDRHRPDEQVRAHRRRQPRRVPLDPAHPPPPRRRPDRHGRRRCLRASSVSSSAARTSWTPCGTRSGATCPELPANTNSLSTKRRDHPMTSDQEAPTATGADAGLSGEQQIRLALEEIVRRGGTASSGHFYEAIEHHMSGHKLSFQGRASLRYFVNRVAVERGLVFAHDPTVPGWRITDAGRRYLQDTGRTDTVQPLRILPIHNKPFLPTVLWLDPGGPDSAEVAISTQPPLDHPLYRVDDLKAWTLGGDPERALPSSDPRRPKKIHRERALRCFFDQLFDAAPRRFIAARELFFLLADAPAEGARAHRRLLARTARELWPQLPVRFLHETEMAFEYVRLIRGDLDFSPNSPAIYIVIDCGARHCTFSAIYTPSDADAPVLRALPSVSVGITGLTVDTNLLTDARSQLGLGKDDPTLDLRAIEYAKLRVARSNRPYTLHGPAGRAWKLQPKRLRHLGGSIVGSFDRPLKQIVAAATAAVYPDATQPGHAPIRGIILSGGASQLPGLEGAVRTLLTLSAEVPCHNLGDQAASAAAIGAMAHVLHRQGRLHPPDSAKAIAALEFFPTLLDDIHLSWTVDDRPPQDLRLAERDRWPTAYQIEEVATVALPAWSKKTASVTLGWGPDAAAHGELLRPKGETQWLAIDCKQRQPELRRAALAHDAIRISSDNPRPEIQDFDTALVPGPSSASQPRPVSSPPSLAYTFPGDALVIDFGAAKTLLVTADAAGAINPESFALPGALAPPQLAEGYTWQPEADETDTNGDEDGDEEFHQSAQEDVREAVRPGPARPLRPADLSEAEFLTKARDLAVAAGLDIPNDALAAVHLAATTRPFVLLAGPPGLGKTTLASFYASLLGCGVDDQTLLWLAIQAHWVSDETLVENDASLLPPLCARGHAYPDLLQVALLDEFNLTRPEYYLSRYFSALDSRVPLAHRKDGPLKLPTDAGGRSRLLTFATLNIDESSRPPSDKILDRAFLIEPAELLRTKKVRRVNLQPPTHRISAATWSRWCDTPSDLDHPEELDAVLAIFDAHASAHPSIIHESLSPSRRAIHDVCTFIHRYQEIGEEALGGMTRAQALDRAIAGRILPRLRGEVAQLRRLLDPLATLFAEQSWLNSLRHIKAMQNRAEFGFVSFWG
jgi:hypothetical protein